MSPPASRWPSLSAAWVTYLSAASTEEERQLLACPAVAAVPRTFAGRPTHSRTGFWWPGEEAAATRAAWPLVVGVAIPVAKREELAARATPEVALALRMRAVLLETRNTAFSSPMRVLLARAARAVAAQVAVAEEATTAVDPTGAAALAEALLIPRLVHSPP